MNTNGFLLIFIFKLNKCTGSIGGHMGSFYEVWEVYGEHAWEGVIGVHLYEVWVVVYVDHMGVIVGLYTLECLIKVPTQ